MGKIPSVSLSAVCTSPRLQQQAIDCSVDPQLSAFIFPHASTFSFLFLFSNYRLSNLCFLVNAPQTVSPGLSGIGREPRNGVSKPLSANRRFESPFPGLRKKKRKIPNPERCSVFLKRIVFHPHRHSKWTLLKWLLRTEAQGERYTVRWNSFWAWVSGNGGLIYCLT